MVLPKKIWLLSALAGTVMASAAATVAFATVRGGDNDANAAPRPAISLAAAVAVAEHRAGGYAVRAEYERGRAGWDYDIEVVTNRDVMDVRIDATSGNVNSIHADAVDREDDEADETDDGSTGEVGEQQQHRR